MASWGLPGNPPPVGTPGYIPEFDPRNFPDAAPPPPAVSEAAPDPYAQAPYRVAPGSSNRITLVKQGEATKVIDAGDYAQAEALTNSGWTPLNAQGHAYKSLIYQGGRAFIDPDTGKGMPLNVLLGGQFTPEQAAGMPVFNAWAASAAGQQAIGAKTSGDPLDWIDGTTGGTIPHSPVPQGGGPLGVLDPNSTVTPSSLATGDFSGLNYQALTRLLVGESLQQGQHGQATLQPIVDSLRESLAGTETNAAKYGGLQQALTLQNMGLVLPGMQQAIGMLGQPQGGLTHDQMVTLQSMLGQASPTLINAMNRTGQPLGGMTEAQMADLRDAFTTASPQINQALGMLGQPQGGVTVDQMGDIRNAYTSAAGPIIDALARMQTPLDQTQGLSAGSLAAMRSNAMDTASRGYDQVEEALKSQLLRSGAMGAQDMPGSTGDIIRGYGGIEADRLAQQSQLLAQAQLADEQARQENYARAQQVGLGTMGELSSLSGGLTNAYLQNAGLGLQGLAANNQTALGAMGALSNLSGGLANTYLQNAGLGLQGMGQNNQLGLGAAGQWGSLMNTIGGQYLQNASLGLQGLGQNNQTALSAMGIGNNILGTVGNIFSPNAYLNASQGNYGNLLGVAQQGTAAGLGGISGASSLMGNLVNAQKNSGLLNAAVGAGGSVLSTLLPALLAA